MDLQLRDKLAIVTGSTKGIGHAIATGLAREGARVVVNGRTDASVAKAIDGLRAAVPSAVVHPFAGDLSRADAAEALVKAFPEPDILVNNLGIFEPKPFEAIPDDDWRRFFEVNVLSGVRLSRLVLPGMKTRDWGRIVFISSESGVQIPTEMIHYGMTKTAQLAVARGLAETVAGTGVTVNSILPGPTLSEGVGDFLRKMAPAGGEADLEEMGRAFIREHRPTSLLGRLATEVAVWADKTDVSEELARLRAHLAQLGALLAGDEPVGRTLEFLIQEVHREVNTIGSKADDLEISQAVIAAKSALEKMREQVANVE